MNDTVMVVLSPCAADGFWYTMRLLFPFRKISPEEGKRLEKKKKRLYCEMMRFLDETVFFE